MHYLPQLHLKSKYFIVPSNTYSGHFGVAAFAASHPTDTDRNKQHNSLLKQHKIYMHEQAMLETLPRASTTHKPTKMLKTCAYDFQKMIGQWNSTANNYAVCM